jgi:DNA-binding transcriptional LysR family regulator
MLAVAESGSFSAAAKKLHLTQSSISHQVARLETHVGHRLFERTTRRCALTTSGHLLIKQARDLLQRLDELELQYRPDALTGHVRIGVPDDYHLFYPVAEAVRDFAREQPRVTLEVQSGLSNQLKEWLKAGELDLTIIREIPGRTSDGVIATEDLVWACKRGTVLNFARPIPLALIFAPCRYRRLALSTLSSARLPHRIIVTCANLGSVFAFVEAGLAITVVSRGSVPDSCMVIGGTHGLPQLPTSTLTFREAAGTNSFVQEALKRRLEDAIRRFIK